MSRRTVFQSGIALLVGALAWCSIRPPAINGQVDLPTVKFNSSRAITIPTVQTAHIPSPPLGRAEGIFDLYKRSPAEQKIHLALNEATEMEFIDTPLSDAMAYLADAHQISMIIDNKALSEEGLAVDEPLNLVVSKIKLKSGLNLCLKGMKLAYIVEDEVLKITTQAVVEKKQLTRVYNTGYLKAVSVEPEGLKTLIQSTIQPEDWRVQRNPITMAKSDKEPQQILLQDAKGIVTIRDAKTGKTLFDVNQGKNSIETLGDMLVISAPQSVHDKIREVLIQVDARWEAERAKK